MAEIVLGVGTSHTPLLTFEAKMWELYAKRDRGDRKLNMSDGRWLTYDQLEKEVEGKYASVATVEHFLAKAAKAQAALDRIADDLAATNPDVVIIVTDDESELFSRANTPAIAIYYGDEIHTHPREVGENAPAFFESMIKTYAMDQVHTFPAMGDFAYELIERLITKEIDIGAASKVEDPKKAGFGHGVGFIINRLFRGKKIPVIPVLLNTYYPPNAPTPSRCYAIGKALAEAIRESDKKLRVAVLASGGLSHFTVDAELDNKVLDAMCSGKSEVLRNIPVQALNSGSSEIRNWIAVAGAIEGLKNRWVEYQPLYRTPAGTGIGVAFGVWS